MYIYYIFLLFSFPEIVAVTSNFITILLTAARYRNSIVIDFKKKKKVILFSLRNKGNSMQYFMEGNAFIYTFLF